MEIPLIFFPTLLLIITSTIDKTFSYSSIDTDRNALLAFKNTFTIDLSAKNWSSNGTSVCHWIGVSCGSKHQRVTALNISGFGLKGTLPPNLGNLTFLRYLDISYNSFAGEIPSWLGELPRLETLILKNNTFSGKIPPSLFNNNINSCKLQILNMGFNSLSGSIPTEIGDCFSLQILKLHSNDLIGPVPKSIFDLPSVKEIWITNNSLSGSLPVDPCNPHLSNLTKLSLSLNQLEGRIPLNIWKCTQLEVLSLSYNRFDGEIPREIGRLSMLKELYLGYNDFKGGIPQEFGRLSMLEMLDIVNASLTGPIPNQIGNCTSLNVLDIGDNHLTGPVPNQIGNCSSLQELYLYSNHFTGGISAEIGRLSRLEIFNIHDADLTGPVPEQLWNSTSLRELYLDNNYLSGSLPLKCSLFNLEILYLNGNELSGEIPSSICTNASKLVELQLSSNSFSGPIPDFGSLRHLRQLLFRDNDLSGAEYPNQELEFFSSLTKCRFLESLEMAGNPLNGILPAASVGNLSTYLQDIYAYNCSINGVIPASIGNLTGMQRLLLTGNELIGSIPPTFGNLKKLQGLHLGSNRLQGYMPRELCGLNNIYHLSLNDNFLTGPIPECLGEVASLRKLFLGSNNMTSTIPSNFWNLKDIVFLNLSSNYFTGQLSSQISGLKAINGLDLSNNKFSGSIPSLIDGCQSLEFLSLSSNKFEGSIPQSFGNVRGLITLDLSNNNLSGSIPKSLEQLRFLQSFNVSYNKLQGEIPVGGQFLTFTAQLFANNSGLCGATRFQVPHCPIENKKTSRLKKARRLIRYILPPFVSIISLAIIILLVLNSRRKRKLKRVQAPSDFTLGATWRRVSYIELVRGTNSFSTETNLLGRGSFGSVFKATLSDELVVAVKVFDLQSERATQSFDTECEILSTIRHRNLVQIIGCCTNTEFKALVLGYMSNGSLEKWLHSDNCRLNLTQRLQIAIEVGLALEYLHHGHTFQIVHCDIKPSNVLLDEDMVAHLADFGISKLFEDGQTMVHTKTLATIGYAAPEYGSEGKVSTNGDVYSYGILLLEMFTKKKPMDDMFSGEMSLREWVYRALQENAVIEVTAPELLLSTEDDQSLTTNEEECISSVFSLAMKCLAVSPDERINMIETVRALQRIKDKVKTATTRRRRYA